jgi:hypothetical protein
MDSLIKSGINVGQKNSAISDEFMMAAERYSIAFHGLFICPECGRTEEL